MRRKLVVITEGASGIGAAMVQTFVDNGYAVVIGDFNDDLGFATAKKFGISHFKTDVRCPESCEELIAKALATHSVETINVLIANVGKNEGMSTAETRVHEWVNSIQLNLNSIFYTCKPALSKMIENGRIILTSSLVGIVGQPNNSAYAAAKGGIISYAKSLALEMASRGITVNAICPHAVDTPLLYEWADAQPEGRAVTLERLRASIPIGRFIQPQEVAAAALFLASPLAGAITGTTLLIDGGASCGC